MDQLNTDQPCLIVRVSKLYEPGMTEEQVYDITRGIWKVGARRDGAKHALAAFQGTIIAAYRIESWHPAGATPYRSGRQLTGSTEGRYEFIGQPADPEFAKTPVGTSVAHLFPQGSANPVMYLNC